MKHFIWLGLKRPFRSTIILTKQDCKHRGSSLKQLKPGRQSNGSKGRAIPVIVSNLPARLIVETTFQPNLPTVYEELLSFENEIYVSAKAGNLGLAGMSFGEASTNFSTCIPVGIIAGDDEILINPVEDRVLVLLMNW